MKKTIKSRPKKYNKKRGRSIKRTRGGDTHFKQTWKTLTGKESLVEQRKAKINKYKLDVTSKIAMKRGSSSSDEEIKKIKDKMDHCSDTLFKNKFNEKIEGDLTQYQIANMYSDTTYYENVKNCYKNALRELDQIESKHDPFKVLEGNVI
jgi:predicted ATPase